MRIVLMSDIHGNLPALRAVAGSLPPYDTVIVAGDHCLSGPSPAEVFDLLAEQGWSLVMGNTDRDIVVGPEMLRGRKSRRVEWTREQLGDERIRALSELPLSVWLSGMDGDSALVVHSNPLNLEDHLFPTMDVDELRPYLDGLDAGVLAFGHLHIPYVRPVEGVLLLDVASVGHPKDLDLRAAYTVLTWADGGRSVNQVRVPYDIHETVRMLRQSDMPDAEEQIAALLKASY
jgi:predicted phosphodiesterase